MSMNTHIEALQTRHKELKNQVQKEASRPSPDFAAITSLKKQKLAIKEELFSIDSNNEKNIASVS